MSPLPKSIQYQNLSGWVRKFQGRKMQKTTYMLPALLMLAALFAINNCFEIQSDSTVQATRYDEAFLECKAITNLTIKQVSWYKIHVKTNKRIYYYEPGNYDQPEMDRLSRSHNDNTSLKIYPVKLEDEGFYVCRVMVWNPRFSVDAPVESNKKMRLVVNVPPSGIQLSTSTLQNNMTLTCRAVGAKPSARIYWLKTAADGSEIVLHSRQKLLEERRGNLSDTTGILDYELTRNERTARISCVVNHTETDTVLFKYVTLVSPTIQNAVEMYLDKIGANVSYSALENQNDDPDNPAGLVKISAEPGFRVIVNSSVKLTATAPGVVPEPQFRWWTGEQAAYSGAELDIKFLDKNKTYYVLAENALGRVLLSVPLTVYDDTDVISPTTQTPNIEDNETLVNSAGMSAGLIAVTVMGCLLACLLIALTVWYCTCKNPPNEGIPNVNKKKIAKTSQESHPFVPSEKPLMRTTSTQTLEGRRSRYEPVPNSAASEDNLLGSTGRRSVIRPAVPPPERPTQAPPAGRRYDSSSAQEDTQSELSIPASEDVV